MSEHLLEPKQIKAPGWMSPSQRADFRRLIRSEIEENGYVSQEKRDQIIDYLDASARLDDLRARLTAAIAENSQFNVEKARILALNSQINALIGLRQKLGEKL